jgi:hypothetical protein
MTLLLGSVYRPLVSLHPVNQVDNHALAPNPKMMLRLFSFTFVHDLDAVFAPTPAKTRRKPVMAKFEHSNLFTHCLKLIP